MKYHDNLYAQGLQQSLEDLRSCGDFCDIAIEAEGHEFKAHKSVLCAASPYFRTMFSTKTSFKESKQDKIIMYEIDSNALSDIIRFIYTSVIEITEENVYSLIEASNLLQITALKACITHYLRNLLTTENCLTLYVIANLHHYYDLAKEAFQYLLTNFYLVTEQDEFLELPLDILLEIVSSKLLNIADESDLLKCILKWVKADVSLRKDYLEQLLTKIDLNHVSVETLMQVQNDPLLKMPFLSKIEEIINDALAKKYDSRMDHISMNKNDMMESGKFRYGAEQGVIFAIGGESCGKASRGIECSTLGYDTWKFVVPRCIVSGSAITETMVIPAMRCARYYSAVAHDSYNVYVIGGRNSTCLLDECESYDIRTNQWRNLCKLPVKLEGATAVLWEGRLMSIGGRSEIGVINQIWEYDEKQFSWNSLPPLSTPRYFHGSVTVGGYIFVLGGYSYSSAVKKDALRSGERYDPNLNKWFEMSPMHEARAKFGCAVIDDCIYVIGGTNKGAGITSVERYNIHTNEWSYMCSMPVPRDSFAVTVYDKRIYCIGGSDTLHFLNTVEKFNPRTNRWHFVNAMQMSRYGLVAATLFVPLITEGTARTRKFDSI